MKRSKITQDEGSPCLSPHEYGNGFEDPKGVFREQRMCWYMAYNERRRLLDIEMGGEDSL